MEPYRLVITIDQKTHGSTYQTPYIYTTECPDRLFCAETMIIWFQLRVGHKYEVMVKTQKKGLFNNANDTIIEILKEIQ